MSDSEYLFSLRGTTETFEGVGRSDGEAASRVFTLSQGVVIADVEPDPHDFVLRIVPEGLSRGQKLLLGGGARAAGKAVGAAFGSAVFPGVGTYLGAVIGALAGPMAVKKYTGMPFLWKALAQPEVGEPQIWEPSFSPQAALVNSNNDAGLREGKHRLVVESEQPWNVKLIQPDIGQSRGPLIDAFEAENWKSGGSHIFGPYHSSARPIFANIQYRGKGVCGAMLVAVDGTHSCSVYSPEKQKPGNFEIADLQTGILPGKEYMLCVMSSDGDWKIKFH